MTQQKILDYLKRKPEYVSGDFLSQRLGISRQALWKQIQQLKESGYDIVAVPHLGYKLVSSPDRLFASEVSRNLNTRFLGRKIYYFDSLSSTMDIAFQLGVKGCSEGTLVLAETQTKGRGRLGREWTSPKYKGIYLSLVLKPKISPHQTPLLTLISAVGLAEAVRDKTGITPQIKWPNDIMIEEKKLGGILTELNAEADLSHFVIIGIGLNVNNDKRSLPVGATSIKEQNKTDTDRIELLQEILRRIERHYLAFQKKGAAAIIDKWREWSVSLGRRVKVSSSRGYIEGQALDIDSDGGLLVRNDAGLIQKVMAGEITHCR